MGDLDTLLRALDERGPLSYRAMPREERSWRGRYALMVAAMGASPAFVWANALAPDFGGSAQVIRALVEETSDSAILMTFSIGGSIEALLPY